MVCVTLRCWRSPPRRVAFSSLTIFRTMPKHFAEFLSAENSSPGVFLVKQRTPLAQVIDELVLVWTASEPGDWTNRMVQIPLR